MGARGYKPLTEDVEERRWLNTVQSSAQRSGVVDVYVTNDAQGVRARDATPSASRYRLPADALYIGRFRLPYSRAALLEEIRAGMKQVRK